jgi:hypothetical protein
MTTIQRVCRVLLACALLTACTERDEADAREPPPVEDTVFGDMVGTMDKARAVEGTAMQQKKEIDRSLDEAEGGQ